LLRLVKIHQFSRQRSYAPLVLLLQVELLQLGGILIDAIPGFHPVFRQYGGVVGVFAQQEVALQG
jgi:hypothetical protein